jgi:ubiquinone/menaquinone biosynthesis methyltransferase
VTPDARTAIADLDARRAHEGDHAAAVRDMFDRIAPTYDALNRMLSLGIDVRWRKRAVKELRASPRGEILDLCAGTLDLSAMLAREYPDAAITACDLSAEMLERGKHKAPRARRIVADAMKLPFADGAFTRAICGFGMRNVADPSIAVREALRVLAPGGALVTLEFFRPVRVRAKAFHAVYARGVLPNVGAVVSGDRGAYAYLARSMKGFLSRREYETALKTAGFVNVRGFDLLLGIASIVVAESPRSKA